MQATKILLFSVSFFAGIFSLFTFAFYFGDWGRLAMVAGFGTFVGIVAAPEFDRTAFKYPVALQALSGGLAGYIISAIFGLAGESTIACTGIGGLVGASASMWVKYVQVP